jgi:hypothetical protein
MSDLATRQCMSVDLWRMWESWCLENLATSSPQLKDILGGLSHIRHVSSQIGSVYCPYKVNYGGSYIRGA